MPAYDYRCTSCGEDHEQRHAPGEQPAPCTGCGATELRKVFKSVGIRFVGSGFHSTDYR